jgi:general secretion pathway protein G
MLDEAKGEESEQGLEEIADQINDFFLKNGRYPDSLDEVISPPPLDPWGRPYEYLRIDGGSVKGKGKLRKDKNLVPINSDYDLYSMGPDGESASPLTANPSKDDIVRGRNGKFFGVATDY